METPSPKVRHAIHEASIVSLCHATLRHHHHTRCQVGLPRLLPLAGTREQPQRMINRRDGGAPRIPRRLIWRCNLRSSRCKLALSRYLVSLFSFGRSSYACMGDPVCMSALPFLACMRMRELVCRCEWEGEGGKGGWRRRMKLYRG